MSNKTRSFKKKYKTYKIISILLLFLPLVIFAVIAFIRGSTTQKVSLGVGVTLAFIFCIANLLFKIAPRSTIWILIIALTVSVERIATVLYVTGTCVIIEECVTSRLEKYYKEKYKMNKEIDERFEINEEEEKDAGKQQSDSAEA